jgi:hypothetical protein
VLSPDAVRLSSNEEVPAQRSSTCRDVATAVTTAAVTIVPATTAWWRHAVARTLEALIPTTVR